MMKRIVLLVALAALVIVVGVAGSMYWAVTSDQQYYVAALERTPATADESSQQLESRFSVLAGDVQSVGKWQTVLTDAEVNGWLAYKLPESFPDLLPEEIRDPRVAITPESVILAARSNVAGVETVVSVFVEPYVTEEGDLALELQQVLAGALPIPTKEILEKVRRATQRMELPIRWTRDGANAVMIVDRELWDSAVEQHRVLEAIELGEGELFLTGQTDEVATDETVADGEAERAGGSSPASELEAASDPPRDE